MQLRPTLYVPCILVLAVATVFLFLHPRTVKAQVPCVAGFADEFPCSNVDLLAYMSPLDLGGADSTVSVNDIWGWTDPTTGREYALVGRVDGTAFVDVTEPTAPIYLGNLPTNTVKAVWRDIKVYREHAYIVADGAASHGMQVFDLGELRFTGQPKTFTPVTVYDSLGSAHNIVVNEASGFGYAVGVNSSGLSCGGGLHMIDLSTPEAPTFAGCFAHTGTGRRGTGYTHDAQCVIYRGPDADYFGREICIASNETAISIADVSNKGAVEIITSASYPTATYVHQGWFSDDHRYFYQDDELDERQGFVPTTRTMIWDLSDLDDPQVVTFHDHGTTNIDHNMYARGDRLYQAHYLNGLRIGDISDPEAIVEVGYFDTMPAFDGQGGGVISPYAGAWSVYPFFDSGNVLISSSNGLFVVRPTGSASFAVDTDPALERGELSLTVAPNPVTEYGTVRMRAPDSQFVRVFIVDALGREVRVLGSQFMTPSSVFEVPVATGDLASGTYFIVARGEKLETTTKFVVVK